MRKIGRSGGVVTELVVRCPRGCVAEELLEWLGRLVGEKNKI